MKKVLLVLIALVLVLSGVAMVSAYEAHTINVKAHVENALELQDLVGTAPDYQMDFGTVFPEEWLIKKFKVTTSDSFCHEDQQRVTRIDYNIYVEKKLGYEWLGDALYFCVNWDYQTYPAGPKAPDMTWVGTVVPPPPLFVMSGYVNKSDRVINEYTVGIDTPVFEGYYNEDTDLAWQDPDNGITKPSGLTKPTVIIKEGEPRYPTDMSLGVDLGADIKIQVTDISKP